MQSVNRYVGVAVAALAITTIPAPSAAQAFITSWGGYGEADGQFRTPQGVAVGGSGEVYVMDGDNNRVSVFTSDGVFLRKWSTPASPVPAGARNIAVDANDNVYVLDYSDALVFRFTSTGTLVTQWNPSPGGRPGFGIAVDGSGNVYVTLGDRIRVFTGLGVFIREWGSSGRRDGEFQNPDGLAIDADGNVYVADQWNYRVQKFTNLGVFLAKWGSEGAGDGQFEGPRRVAIGSGGTVYVVDGGNTRVQAFTSEGAFITKWGSAGTAPGQFDNPIGIAVDARGDIYVADTNNSRIQKFAPGTPTAMQGVTWGAVKSRYRGERDTAGPGR